MFNYIMRFWSKPTTPTKKVVGQCYIGQHATTGQYVLMEFRNHTMVGPITQVSQDEMTRCGLSIILRRLQDGPAADSRPLSFNDADTKKEMLKLKRHHCLVSVVLLESDHREIKMVPLHAGHGWAFDSSGEEVRTFPVPETNEVFMKHLREALEIAT